MDQESAGFAPERRPGRAASRPRDRVGPEPNRIEQRGVPQSPLDGFQLKRFTGRRPGLPGLVAGLVAVGGGLDGCRQGHRSHAGQLEQVTRPAPCPRYRIVQRIGQASRAVVPEDQIPLGASDLAGAAVGLEVSITPALGVRVVQVLASGAPGAQDGHGRPILDEDRGISGVHVEGSGADGPGTEA